MLLSALLSFAIIEALSHELPVVATDVGGTCDIINSETMCGSLVSYGDVSGCADEIMKYISDNEKYEKASKNALECVKAYFDIENVFETVYNRYIESLK